MRCLAEQYIASITDLIDERGEVINIFKFVAGGVDLACQLVEINLWL